jgi:hypothetical protein
MSAIIPLEIGLFALALFPESGFSALMIHGASVSVQSAALYAYRW